MFVPPMSLVLVIPLGVAADVRTGEWGSATGVVMLGLVSGVIAWRRFRVRLVADAGEVLVFNTFRTWHIPWLRPMNLRARATWRAPRRA